MKKAAIIASFALAMVNASAELPLVLPGPPAADAVVDVTKPWPSPPRGEQGCQPERFDLILSRDVLGTFPVSSSPRLSQAGAALKRNCEA